MRLITKNRFSFSFFKKKKIEYFQKKNLGFFLIGFESCFKK